MSFGTVFAPLIFPADRIARQDSRPIAGQTAHKLSSVRNESVPCRSTQPSIGPPILLERHSDGCRWKVWREPVEGPAMGTQKPGLGAMKSGEKSTRRQTEAFRPGGRENTAVPIVEMCSHYFASVAIYALRSTSQFNTPLPRESPIRSATLNSPRKNTLVNSVPAVDHIGSNDAAMAHETPIAAKRQRQGQDLFTSWSMELSRPSWQAPAFPANPRNQLRFLLRRPSRPDSLRNICGR